MAKKLKINELKVKSFATSSEKSPAKTIKGGLYKDVIISAPDETQLGIACNSGCIPPGCADFPISIGVH